MSKSEIFICFNCGTKNRVPAGRLPSAKCGKCKKLLLEAQTTPTSESHAQSSRAPLKATAGARKDRASPWRLIFFAAALFGVGYLFISEQRNGPSRPAIQASLPPVVYQDPGIMWNNTGRIGTGPFRVITSPGADYYIKLVDYNSGADMLGIFVNGGRTLDVPVPPGSYRLRYAYGESWRGQAALFGPGRNTTFQQSPTRFDFSSNSGYTVELIRQSGGNMTTTSIGANQF